MNEQTVTQALTAALDRLDDVFELLTDTITIPCPEPRAGWSWVAYSDAPLPVAAHLSLRIEVTWRADTMFYMVKDWMGTPLWSKRFTLKWSGFPDG